MASSLIAAAVLTPGLVRAAPLGAPAASAALAPDARLVGKAFWFGRDRSYRRSYRSYRRPWRRPRTYSYGLAVPYYSYRRRPTVYRDYGYGRPYDRGRRSFFSYSYGNPRARGSSRRRPAHNSR